MPGYTPIKTFEDGSGLYTGPDGQAYSYDPESGTYAPWIGSTEFGGGGYRLGGPGDPGGPQAAAEPDPALLDGAAGWGGMGAPGLPQQAPAGGTGQNVYGRLAESPVPEVAARGQAGMNWGQPVAAENPAQALLAGMAPQGLPGFPAQPDPNARPPLPTVNHTPPTPPPAPPTPGAPGSRRRLDRAPAYGAPGTGAQPAGGRTTVAGTYGSRLLDAGRRLRGR